MDLGLRGRVYVVTGGSGGLGRASADALVADGAKVVISGRHRDSVDAAVSELGAGSATGVVADNADPGTPAALVAAARAAYGRARRGTDLGGRAAGRLDPRRRGRGLDGGVRVGVPRVACGSAGRSAGSWRTAARSPTCCRRR